MQELLTEAQSRLAACQETLKAELKTRAEAESAAATWEKTASEAGERIKTLYIEHEKEKQSLIKRATNVEEKLKAATEELGSLKKHIRQMTHAIFGKPPQHCAASCFSESLTLRCFMLGSYRQEELKSPERACRPVEGGVHLSGAAVY
jgi:hypothetical protein